jgi:hypothetical protein
MTFPQSILDTRVELLLAGVWTDITSYVYVRNPVQITRGHPDEAGSINPTMCSLTLNNRGGRFSPRNPVGPYFGNLTRNTQMRLSVPEGLTYLRMEADSVSYASCPDSAPLRITGDIEIQADMWLTDYGQSVIASKWAAGNQAAWHLMINDSGIVRLFWSVTGSDLHIANSTLPLTVGRIAIKVTLSAATGTVTFYTAPTIAGPWTPLGSAVVKGATSVFASTAPLAIGANASLVNTGTFIQEPEKGATGKVYAFKLLSGVGGTTVASPTFTAQAAGTTAFADAQGNAWTLSGTAEVSDRKYRTHVEVPAWPPRWDPTGVDVYTPIQGSGRWRRLVAGSPPTYSALYRAFVRLTGTTAPVAYWPCEDGSNATTIASGLPGLAAMSFTGAPRFAADTTFPSSAALPQLNGSMWTGAVPVRGTPYPPGNTLWLLLSVPSGGDTNNGVVARMNTDGTIARFDLVYTTAGGGSITAFAYDASGAQLFTLGAISGINGVPMLLTVQIVSDPAAGQLDWQVTSTPLDRSLTGTALSGAQSGSIGRPSQVIINAGGLMVGSSVGHVACQAAADQFDEAILSALIGWAGEYAGSRFARLCAEEGIPCRIYGPPADTVAMGVQTAKAVAALLQECEDADRGLIFEPRQVFGLGYRTRVSMLNQAPDLSLSYAGAQLSEPMEPTDDDRLIANDVTVTRASGGSSARQSLASGALSTQAPPNGVGPYAQSPTVSLAADSQLADQAAWLVLLGTVDDLRYPVLSVNLASPHVASVYYQAQDIDIGDRVIVTGTPGWLPPDGISQIVHGQTEQCYDVVFTEQWACAPEAPYRVGVLDDPVLGRADTDGSTLHAGISSTATSMQVDTTDPATPLWTTAAGDFPLDIVMSGERITVGAISGASSPQTFSSLTRSVNGVVKAQTAGTDIRLWQPMYTSL